MESTRTEYLAFFSKWINYQFSRPSDLVRNTLLTREVGKIVDTDEEAAYWGGRDCWTMYDMACKNLASRAIVAVE